jgi:hypothetical protein
MGFELALPTTMGRSDEASDARFRSMAEAHVDAVWRLLRRLQVPAAAAPDGVRRSSWSRCGGGVPSRRSRDGPRPSPKATVRLDLAPGGHRQQLNTASSVMTRP